MYIYNRDSQITERSIVGKQESENYFYNLDGSLLATINANGIDEFTYTNNGQANKYIRNGKILAEYEYNNDNIMVMINYNYCQQYSILRWE